MKEIKLTQDKVALVDDEDFDKLSSFKWYALEKYKNRFYAIRNQVKAEYKNSKRTCLQMHRIILGLTDPKVIIDHINLNTLDNRKENLRICTRNENARNVTKRETNTSGYKGVFWYKKLNKWIAQIHFNKKTINLGYFVDKIEAAKEYDKAALKYFGKFARINFEKMGEIKNEVK